MRELFTLEPDEFFRVVHAKIDEIELSLRGIDKPLPTTRLQFFDVPKRKNFRKLQTNLQYFSVPDKIPVPRVGEYLDGLRGQYASSDFWLNEMLDASRGAPFYSLPSSVEVVPNVELLGAAVDELDKALRLLSDSGMYVSLSGARFTVSPKSFRGSIQLSYMDEVVSQGFGLKEIFTEAIDLVMWSPRHSGREQVARVVDTAISHLINETHNMRMIYSLEETFVGLEGIL